MNSHKYITAIILLILIMTTPMTAATGSIAPGDISVALKIPVASHQRQKSIALAENKSNNPAKREDSETEAARSGSESGNGSKTGDTAPSTKVKKTILKSFVPSEKIPADQAVDFPVDI